MQQSVTLTSCPTFSINGSEDSSRHYESVMCKPTKEKEKDCFKANKKYGRSALPYAGYCHKQHVHQVLHKLCFFKILENNKPQVICNVNVCRSSVVRIGIFQSENGRFMPLNQWYMAYNHTAVESIVLNLYHHTEESFCMLACFFQNRYIKQALVFPPRTKSMNNNQNKNNLVNVNIIVLDSVSRQHFYRKLPTSVSKLSMLQKTGAALVLDYELFQSLAPRTFPNMRAMFSGRVDIDADDEENSYGLDELIGHYKELGYQTLLQEDSCWFDSWGALITDNKHNENIASDWDNLYQKLKRMPIDDYGLTHLSCEVFAQYGRTNQFNYPNKVCFNGHLLPEYFLKYSLQYIQAIENDISAKPGFLYTHLNTGHETTGQRIAQMDNILSTYISGYATLENTLTIIMSDHGPKTTIYSQEYLSGRYEIGHAFMFMILPKNVQNILGPQKISALTTNQRRLISALDLHKTLKTLNSNLYDGLLKPLEAKRYCHDIPMYTFMNCLCDGFVQEIDPSYGLQWLAEFNIGYLNQQLTDTLIKNNYTNGYGNCERLTGRRFDKVRRSIDSTGTSFIYLMDIHADKYRGKEIFEVVTKVVYKSAHSKEISSVQVLRWRRVTIYQHFVKCCDKHVNIELCICRKESSNLKNPGRDLSRLLTTPIFDTQTTSTFLDSKCLILLTRTLPNYFYIYELSNTCSDRKYETNFQLTSQYDPIKSTTNLPVNVTVQPWFIQYITTVILDDEQSMKPVENITFVIKYL